MNGKRQTELYSQSCDGSWILKSKPRVNSKIGHSPGVKVMPFSYVLHEFVVPRKSVSGLVMATICGALIDGAGEGEMLL
jgi:hypothetical protein